MLRKLLKYDFKAVLKYWWIAAVSSVLLSALGGFCISVFRQSSIGEVKIPEIIIVCAVLLFVLVIIGISAFILLSEVLIFIRFYKNFFSDEGYLTFTLPVKQSQLLNSKLIMSGVTNILTIIVFALDILVMLAITFFDEIFTKNFFEQLATIIRELIKQIDIYTIVYIIEILAIFLIAIIFSHLFMYACITFASMITKKAKLITAIGIYYGASSVLSFGVMIFNTFGTTSLSTAFALLPENGQKMIVTVILLGVVFFTAMLVALLYAFEYWMLDRKLNLA